MSENSPNEYHYLNRENTWLGFRSHGLELRPDGAMQLAVVPRLDVDLLPTIAALPKPFGPAGLVFDDQGGIYFTLPDEDNLLGKPDCAKTYEPLPCLSGSGSLPGQLNEPSGLAFDQTRRALVVADSANHRVKFLNLPDGELREVWGSTGEPGVSPWELDTPSAVAVDRRGFIYVAGLGEKPVQKFDPRGLPVEKFFENTVTSTSWSQPIGLAVSPSRHSQHLYVLDAGRGVVVVLDTNGHLLAEFGANQLIEPLGLAIDETSVYIGDNQRRQVLRFQIIADFPLSGPAVGYDGPVAALALDRRGGLWVHPGAGEPLRMTLADAYARSGVLWGGPIGTADRPMIWHTLKTWVEGLGPGAHLQCFIATGENDSVPPLDPLPLDPRPFSNQEWYGFPLDVTEAFIPYVETPKKVTYDPVPHRQMPYIWVGFHFIGDNSASPILHQARLTFNHNTYRQHLPAIFSAEADQADLLDRLLSLFESFNLETEEEIAEIRHYFDPQTSPAPWLRWLAGWLALDIDGRWSESQQRAAIAHAMSLYRMRGTPFGLRTAISFFTGITSRIAEPIQYADWWSLGEDTPSTQNQPQASSLGFTTRLAPVQDDGAVLGGTAQLDASHLENGERFGAPLFENVAHQFIVQVYKNQVTNPARKAQLEQIIQREKPAHTLSHLCVIEPHMRVGIQSLVGLNTVVAGQKQSQTSIGESVLHPRGLELAGQPAGKIGESSQVGQDTRLTQITPA